MVWASWFSSFFSFMFRLAETIQRGVERWCKWIKFGHYWDLRQTSHGYGEDRSKGDVRDWFAQFNLFKTALSVLEAVDLTRFFLSSESPPTSSLNMFNPHSRFPIGNQFKIKRKKNVDQESAMTAFFSLHRRWLASLEVKGLKGGVRDERNIWTTPFSISEIFLSPGFSQN